MNLKGGHAPKTPSKTQRRPSFSKDKNMQTKTQITEYEICDMIGQAALFIMVLLIIIFCMSSALSGSTNPDFNGPTLSERIDIREGKNE